MRLSIISNPFSGSTHLACARLRCQDNFALLANFPRRPQGEGARPFHCQLSAANPHLFQGQSCIPTERRSVSAFFFSFSASIVGGSDCFVTPSTTGPAAPDNSLLR